MPLNIVIGKSGSGKSEYIYTSMLKDVSSGKHALLFVPPMARVVAEKEYLKCLNKNSITDVTITTIDRYIKNNIQELKLYKTKEYLPDLARKMYIKDLIHKYEDELNIFAKAKDSKSFVDLLYTYMDIFEKENISKECIEEKYEYQDFTKAKLLELCNIYEKINQERKEKYSDSLDELQLYINKILENKKIYEDIVIYFDSYNNFSKNEYAYIATLLKLGVSVTVSINMDLPTAENITTGIFAESYSTYLKLNDLAENIGAKYTEQFLTKLNDYQKEDIRFLANNIFDANKQKYLGKEKNVNIYLLANPYEEIEYIAKDITSKIKEDKARYKDFVIYTHSIEEYYLCIKRVFTKYGIPVFCNTKENIKNSKISKYIMLLLDIAINGFEYRNNNKLLELLKTGFIQLPEDQICLFENYLSSLDIKGYMLKKEFTKNVNKVQEYEYDLELLNDIRIKIIQKVGSFSSKLLLAKTCKQITKEIYDYLQENEVIQDFENELKNIAIDCAEAENKQQQILSRIYEIMDNICLVKDEITLSEYFNLLEYGLNEESVLSIPALSDQVEVADINKTRNVSVNYGYIIGVNENSIPSNISQDATFTEIELERMKSLGLDIKKTSIDKMNMELFNVYLAISKCQENLTFLIPSSKITGETLRISSVIREVQEILGLKVTSIKTEETVYLKDKLFEENVREMQMKENTDASYLKLYTEYIYLDKSDRFNKIFEYERKADNLEEDTTNKLYGKEVNLSVSRLEALKRCPFAYYSKYVLALKDKKEYKLSRLDMGSIMHEVLEKVSRNLTAKNIKWSDIAGNEKNISYIEKNANEIIDNIFEVEYPKHKENIRLEVLKINLKRSMIKILLNISESMAQSSFEPIGYEIAFDNNALFAPIEIKIDDGRSIYLRGKIDRVDMAKIGDAAYFRIIDYKSSTKTLSLADVKEGLSLQLITYMSAMLENKDKMIDDKRAVPAALNYFTLNTSLINLSEYEKNEELLKKKIIEAVKLKGIFLKDIEVLKQMDHKSEKQDTSYIDVNVTRMTNENKYLPEDLFLEECKNVKATLKKLSGEVVKGNVKIAPHDTKVCEYCEYNSICRRKNCV